MSILYVEKAILVVSDTMHPKLKELQQKLDNLPADTLVLMITHQVTINAVTKISPASGGFVVYNSRTKVSKSVQLNTP